MGGGSWLKTCVWLQCWTPTTPHPGTRKTATTQLQTLRL